jgi:hypothetical protein
MKWQKNGYKNCKNSPLPTIFGKSSAGFLFVYRMAWRFYTNTESNTNTKKKFGGQRWRGMNHESKQQKRTYREYSINKQ